MNRTKDIVESVLDAVETIPRYFMEPWGQSLEKWNEPVEERKFEVSLGEYKTIITYKFNKKGYPVSHTHTSEKIVSEKEQKLQALNRDLDKAVKEKKFLDAAKIQEEIDLLK